MAHREPPIRGAGESAEGGEAMKDEAALAWLLGEHAAYCGCGHSIFLIAFERASRDI